MNFTEKAMKEMLDSFIYIIDSKLRKVPKDITKKSVVVLKNDDGTYNVSINNNIYENVISRSHLVHNVGDVAMVVIPESNYSDMFIGW